jgi:glutathione peroxidase
MTNKIFQSYIILITTIAIIYSCSAENKDNNMTKTIYDFSVKTNEGKQKSLRDYKGKVLLIVNVASYCGYTKQYKGLEEIYKKYRDKGFEIIAFPCNQFGEQEPGTNEEIKNFCSTNYKITFQLFDKIDVNGDNAHPMYKFLKDEKPGILGTKDIKWNFTKFLIDKNGKVIDRYASNKTPEDIAPDIDKLLK